MATGENEDRLSKRLSRGSPLAAIVLVVLGVGVFLAYKLLFILELIAIAMLLALVIRTIVNGLERLGSPPWLAVIIMLAGVAAFGSFVWFVIIPNVLQEVRSLIPEGPGSLQQEAQTLISRVTDFLQGLPLIPADLLSQLPQQLGVYLFGLGGSLPGSLPTLASAASSVLVGSIAVVFLAIYFAVKPDTYVSGILRLVPSDRRERAGEIVDHLGKRLRAWIAGTLIVALFMGVGAWVGLWILGIPLPLTFGIIVGILSVIPFLGSAVGGLFPGLLALTISIPKAILVGVLFLILAQLDGNVLRPLIYGHEIKVPPGWVLVSILVLGVLLGPIVGVFLAVPAAVVIRVLVDELTEKKPPPVEDGAEEKPPDGSHK